jgi:hypothetical protein
MAYPDNDAEAVPVPHSGPQVSALPEAAFSLTRRGTYQGHAGTLLTVRGQTAAEFHANLQAVQGLLRAPEATQQAPTPAQGQGKDWCQKHSVPMKLNHGKDGRTWYSHRVDGGFCKGR